MASAQAAAAAEKAVTQIRTRSDGHRPVLSAAPQSSIPALENVIVFGLKQLHFVVPLRHTVKTQVSRAQSFHVSSAVGL